MTLEPVLTPHGLLTLRETGEALALEPEQGLRLEKAFARGSGHGLLWLGASEVGTALPPVLSYWRELGVRYVTALCALPGIGESKVKPPVPIPGDSEFDTITAAVPPMIGAEYLTADVLANLWRDMDAAFDAELAEARLSVQEYLKSCHPAWNLVGRVHFNLAENRKDEDAPFAFLATYTTRLSAAARGRIMLTIVRWENARRSKMNMIAQASVGSPRDHRLPLSHEHRPSLCRRATRFA